MIPIKEVRDLPELDWTDHAVLEMMQDGLDLLNFTNVMFQVGDACICGLIYNTFTSPPWFWFALAKGTKIRDLIDFRAASEKIPWGALTAVQDNYRIGKRFAEFYGFVPLNEKVVHGDRVYHIYRKEY